VTQTSSDNTLSHMCLVNNSNTVHHENHKQTIRMIRMLSLHVCVILRAANNGNSKTNQYLQYTDDGYNIDNHFLVFICTPNHMQSTTETCHNMQ